MSSCVGVTGLLTTKVAIFVFSHSQDYAMVEQSRSLHRNSLQLVKQGLYNVFMAPIVLRKFKRDS